MERPWDIQRAMQRGASLDEGWDGEREEWREEGWEYGWGRKWDGKLEMPREQRSELEKVH